VFCSKTALRPQPGLSLAPSLGTKLAKSMAMSTSQSTPSSLWTSDRTPRPEGQDPGPSGRAFLRWIRGRWVLVALAFGWLGFVVLPAQAVVDTALAGPDHWQWLGSVGGGGGDSIALAQSIHGDIAVADDTGVSWWREDVRERAVLPAIADLAFDSQGLLWIATSEGLFSWTRSGRPARRRLAGGEAGNRIARIAVSDSTLLLATDAGAVWSSTGKIFQPLRDSAVAGVISHVALRPARFDRRDGGTRSRQAGHSAFTGYAGIAQAWLYGAGRLSVIRGLESVSGIRVTGGEVLPISLPRPGAGDEQGVVDLVIDPQGRRLYLVFEDAIAWRWIDEEASASASSTSGWRFERPNLPPGALIRALGWASGRIWLATDHGLLSADSIHGPFRRAASPVGTTSCVDLQPRDFEQALALCRTGLFALSTGSAGSEPGLEVADRSAQKLPSASRLLPDPPLDEIRRRALVRSGLTVGRAHNMWDRLRRRAYWPDLELSLDVDFDYDQEDDADQAFISGDTRRLVDRTRDEGRSYRAAIELDWRLGGIVYPLETVDLSRELRQIVSLRDDVADEINQLYFERQAIRQSLASSSAATDATEVVRLTWRARELDAGLDAWTGGWISRWRALSPPFPFQESDPDLDLETDPGSTHHPQTITPITRSKGR
jgi:hypothetical protein